jgi:2-oxoglutarate ferredoxin oxidoreductase subunit alpha
MGEKVFMQGNMAMAEAAIRAGCKLFCGYPITPSSEVAEYFARAMVERPEENITFIQAETEVSAFNMVAGAASAGHRVMTATSGPGFDLGQEAMSYMCGGNLAGVIVDIMRPGPGDGDIMASQSDYYQVTRGGGHGDYRTLVLAPYSVQELCDLMQESFDLAQKYHNPVVLVSDGNLAKLRESVEIPGYVTPPIPAEQYNALRGCGTTREPHKVRTGCSGHLETVSYNLKLQEKFNRIAANEVRYETYMVEDADLVLVVWGSFSRVCISAMKEARAEGIKVGMIRPISLWPFPDKAFENLNGKKFLVCELNAGQMVDDVKLAVENKHDVYLFNRFGSALPSPLEVLEAIREIEVK